MAVMKVTTLFDAPGTGWSETFYMNAEGPTDAIKRTNTQYFPYRRAIMPATTGGVVKILGVRAQQVDTPKNMRVATVNQPGTYPVLDPNAAADTPWSGFLMRFTGEDNSFRMFTLRGVPDEVMEGYYRDGPSRNAWIIAWQEWRDRIIDMQLGIYSITEAGNDLRDIESITAGAGFITVTTVVNHGLATGDQIVFYHVSAGAKIQGRYTVTVTAVKSFTVRPFNIGTVGFISGQYRKLVRGLQLIKDGVIERKGERKVGRPFLLLRGRK